MKMTASLVEAVIFLDGLFFYPASGVFNGTGEFSMNFHPPDLLEYYWLQRSAVLDFAVFSGNRIDPDIIIRKLVKDEKIKDIFL